jgi:hypothetical protein
MGIKEISTKILNVCQKSEKEYVLKLKESSRNPLMKMSEHGSSSSSSEENTDFDDSDRKKKPPSHSRRLSGGASSENPSTAGGYIAKVEKDLNKILKK